MIFFYASKKEKKEKNFSFSKFPWGKNEKHQRLGWRFLGIKTFIRRFVHSMESLLTHLPTCHSRKKTNGHFPFRRVCLCISCVLDNR